jgi:hypothetical protein
VLTLADGQRLGAYTVFRDSIFDGAKRSYTSSFYVLPDSPRLGRDADGGPAFDFLWYRAPPETANAGGLVTLTVDLAPSDDERASLEQAIAAAYPSEPPAAIQVLPVPFRDGTVEVTFAGESGNGDFATQVAGSGPARLAGWQRATFAVAMTRDGAALLWKTIQDGPAVFQVRYDLVFDAHLDDIRLRVWCDVRSSLRVASDELAAGSLDPSALRETLTTQHLAGMELVSERPIPPEDEETLQRLGNQILESTLASALFEPGAGSDGSLTRLRPYAAEMETRLNHTFTQSFPVERHAVLESLIRLDGGAQDLGNRLRQIDLDGGFFRVMEVKVYCTVDFANDPIETVKATVIYEATGETGPVRRTSELVFREGVPVQTARFDLAAPDQRSYRYDVDVYYRDAAPVTLSFPPGDATAVVLDLDGLGVLRVDVELRDVPFDVVRSVVVDLSHGRSGLSRKMILDGRRTSDTWEAVVRTEPGPYTYRVAWITDRGRIEQPALDSTAPRLLLDAPDELRETTTKVLLVSAGDFSQLAEIVVELRTGADSSDVASLSFTEAGHTETWQPALTDPDHLQYEVRTTLVYRDGTREESAWGSDDRPVHVVRDALRFQVSVVPRLLDLGGSIALALLELAFDDDEADVHAHQTLAIRDRNEKPQWNLRLGAPDRHTYRYRSTLVAKDGSRATSDWREAEDSILVLQPN